MDVLRITVVGQDLFKLVEHKMELVGINKVNQLNTGMLGNLKTLTFEIEIKESEIIKKRAELMDKIAEDSMRLMPLYVHKDYMRIFVIKPMLM